MASVFLNQYNVLISLQIPEIHLHRHNPVALHAAIFPYLHLIGRPLITSAQMKHLSNFDEWSHDLLDQFNFIGTYNLFYNASLLVEAGAGIALTYEHIIDTECDNRLVFRPLNPELTEPNTLIWNKSRRLPNVSQLFLDTLKNLI